MKKTIFFVLKMIGTIVSLFIAPFIFPLLAKLFIYWKWFENIEDLQNTIKVFSNMYTLISIIIMVLILLWFFHDWKDVKKIFQGIRSFKLKDFEISKESAENVIKENEEKTKIIKELKEDNKNNSADSEESKKAIKEQLFSQKKNNDICDNSNLVNENKRLKYYSAYNIINVETKGLLHKIYNEKYIETEEFKKQIIDGYTRRNKHNIKFSKKDINKVATSKYNTIYEGLLYLNIIEPSEDDKEIRLTNEGKEFVEKYIEGGAL
ncbi:MAG: hypothetical protein MSA89_09695 [Clostridium sp.]|nr:hypothetical protein [Clostridium sp.]